MVLEYLLKMAPFLPCIIGSVAIYIASYRYISDMIINDASFRKVRFDELDRYENESKQPGAAFSTYLERALAFCEKGWGPLKSPKAVGMSLVIALFYSSALFLACWTAMGPGSIGTTALLSDKWHQTQRIIFTGVISFFSIIIIFLIVRSLEIENCFLRRMRRFKSPRAIFYLVGCIIVGIIFFLPPYLHSSGLKGFEVFLILGLSVPFLTTIVAGYRMPGAVSVLAALCFLGIVPEYMSLFVEEPVPAAVAFISIAGFAAAFFLGVKEKGRSHMAIGITGSIGGFFVGYISSAAGSFSKMFNNSAIIAMMIFLMLLPLVNGLFDWLSLTITRWLGEHLKEKLKHLNAKHRPKWIATIQGFIAFDLFFAFLLLFLITGGLVAIIQMYNYSAAQAGYSPPLELNGFLEQVKNYPIGAAGLWATCMVFSTLLPTFAHLVAVGFASVFALYPSITPLSELRGKFGGLSNVDRRKASEQIARSYIIHKLIKFVGPCLALFVAWGLFLAAIWYVTNMGLKDIINAYALWVMSFWKIK